MDNFSNNLKKIMEERGLSQVDLAKMTGITQSSISDWLNDKYEPKQNKIFQISNALHVSPSALIGSSIFPSSTPTAVRINVFGQIPAGTPLEAIEDIIDWEEIPADWCKGGKEFFALQVKGDSMYPEYLEGDIIICQIQPDFEDGQDCVVFVNGYNATLKRCYHTDHGVQLVPINTAYSPKSYSLAEEAADYLVEEEPVRILGVVKEIRRKK